MVATIVLNAGALSALRALLRFPAAIANRRRSLVARFNSASNVAPSRERQIVPDPSSLARVSERAVSAAMVE
jgi:hypothetical protein